MSVFRVKFLLVGYPSTRTNSSFKSYQNPSISQLKLWPFGKSQIVYRQIFFCKNTDYKEDYSPDYVNFCQPVIIRNQFYGQYNCKILLSFYRFEILIAMKVWQNSKIRITVMVKFMKALNLDNCQTYDCMHFLK